MKVLHYIPVAIQKSGNDDVIHEITYEKFTIEQKSYLEISGTQNSAR